MSESVTTAALFNCRTPYLKELFEAHYPWEILPRIGDWIKALITAGLEGFEEIAPDVWIGKNVSIGNYVTLEGPAIIGHGTTIRHGAYLRGNVITGENCVLGNSCEFKNCVLLDHVQAPHYNYVGDSVLGNGAHLGAGVVCSNLKADGKDVLIRTAAPLATSLRKVGAFLGDGADIGCGCVLNPGCIVGQNTSVYPLTALRGVYPADHIIKSADTAVPRQ